MVEAVNLFKVSTVEAAQSGINQQVTLTPEIKVCRCHCYYLFCFPSVMSSQHPAIGVSIFVSVRFFVKKVTKLNLIF